MKKNYEKPKAQLVIFQVNKAIMDVDMEYSEGFDEDFG